MSSYGPNDAAYRESLHRFARCRWLRPDGELEALAPSAVAWMTDRLDELRAALNPFVDDAVPAPVLATERSARAACARWTAAWDAPDLAPSPVIAALDDAAAQADARLASLLTNAQRTALTREIREELAATSDAPSPWSEELRRHEETSRRDGRDVHPREPGLRHPAALTVEQHLRWVVAFGDDALTPSPWAPIAAMFERGAWPVLLPDATVLVYVPVLRDARLVPEPSKPGRQRRFPVRAPSPARLASKFPSLAQVGVSVPPSHMEYEPRHMLLGEIAQVGTDPPDASWRFDDDAEG